MLNKKVYYAMLIFCAVVFVASSAYIVSYMIRSFRQGEEYNELSNLKESLQATQPTPAALWLEFKLPCSAETDRRTK